MKLNNEYLYGYATNMEERIKVLSITEENKTLSNLKKWRNRKSLLSDSDFKHMLAIRNISEIQYDLAVSPLNQSSLKKLFTYVTKQEWFKIHKKIFSIDRTYTPDSVKSALYFHVQFYMDFASELSHKYNEIAFDNSCLKLLEENITTQLMNLAQKTLVWDVHAKLDEDSLECLNDSDALKYYLNERFGNNSTEYFFLEYPTLSRLLAERIIYAMDNLQIIIDSFYNYRYEVTKIFGIRLPFAINAIESHKGDSHNRGKATTILKINNITLVYKFRSNDILNKYNTLLSLLEKNNPDFKSYKILHIVGKDFCIEEFIENENCMNENDIVEYYKNYGHLVALTYWLGSSDLHKENLIAKGSYPVIIDLETLLRAEERRTYSEDFTKIKYFESNSVISTGMLPMEKYWKKQLDYSALNGIKQKLPFKVRKLLNEDSSKIAFELCEAYTKPANNIPILNGKRITYEDYCQYIQISFEEMLLWLNKNGNSIYKQIEKDFNSTIIRIVLRDTQDYCNFLAFSTHPSCMVDYIEREKIFENLWNNSFIDSQIVLHEVAALCRHDIPYFYTSTCSKDIFSLDGKVEKFFSHNILTTLRSHNASITQYNIDYSTFLLGESLGCLSSKCKPVVLRSTHTSENIFMDKANDIASRILDNVIINTKEKTVLWPEPINQGETILIDYPDSNLYNGSAGLFVFFYLLNKLNPNYKYSRILHSLEYEVFHSNHLSDFESAFYGRSSRISAAFIAYYFDKDLKFYHYLIEYLSETKKYASNIKSWDWIRGKSSLMALLVTIYEECHLPIIKSILKALVSDIDYIDVAEIGFAHGYSGILYALLRTNEILKDANIDKKIIELHKIIVKQLQINNTYSPAWCNGTIGINKALCEFSKHYPGNNIDFIEPTKGYIQNNSCICHGTFSDISLYNKINRGEVTDDFYRIELNDFARKELFLCGYRQFIPLGLFSGLSGIGYQLIHCVSPDNTLELLFFT